MPELIDGLFFRVWWRWSGADSDLFSTVYHWFNIIEGLVWFAFFGLVLERWYRHRHSHLEIYYALTFLCFGMTDIREAWQQSSLLIWLKLIILAALVCLRCTVMRRYYPESRLY